MTPPGLTRQLSGMVITGFFALGAQHAWVTYGGIKNGAAQHIAATTDGGRRWTVVGREPLTKVGFSTYVYDCGLDFVTPSVGWCQAEPPYVGAEGVDLYRTTDGGRHWQRVSVTGPDGNKPGSLPWGGDKDIQFTSQSTGWASFTGPKAAPLYETTNGGKTWIKRRVAAPARRPDRPGSGFAERAAGGREPGRGRLHHRRLAAEVSGLRQHRPRRGVAAGLPRPARPRAGSRTPSAGRAGGWWPATTSWPPTTPAGPGAPSPAT